MSMGTAINHYKKTVVDAIGSPLGDSGWSGDGVFSLCGIVAVVLSSSKLYIHSPNSRQNFRNYPSETDIQEQ